MNNSTHYTLRNMSLYSTLYLSFICIIIVILLCKQQRTPPLTNLSKKRKKQTAKQTVESENSQEMENQAHKPQTNIEVSNHIDELKVNKNIHPKQVILNKKSDSSVETNCSSFPRKTTLTDVKPTENENNQKVIDDKKVVPTDNKVHRVVTKNEPDPNLYESVRTKTEIGQVLRKAVLQDDHDYEYCVPEAESPPISARNKLSSIDKAKHDTVIKMLDAVNDQKNCITINKTQNDIGCEDETNKTGVTSKQTNQTQFGAANANPNYETFRDDILPVLEEDTK